MYLNSLIALSAATVDKPTGFIGALATGAEDFIKVFNKGGSVLLSLMGGILPTLIVLLTAVNALVRIIGAERIENLGKAAARPGLQWYPVRYILLPFVSANSGNANCATSSVPSRTSSGKTSARSRCSRSFASTTRQAAGVIASRFAVRRAATTSALAPTSRPTSWGRASTSPS